ncbi:hypothetical protein ACFXG4_03655 [Nocardia sp. NPDC059246]|uniref:DUF7427 family protein n=1 Tax=unclassified Nocardia TaxID=2637762 RepID=UPI003692284F
MSTFRARIKSGDLWLAVGAAVVGAELIAPPGELLSEGVDRAIQRRPVMTRTAIAVTALHLANLLPRQVDPFTILLRVSTSCLRLLRSVVSHTTHAPHA